MVALLTTATETPCPPFEGARAGGHVEPISLVENGSFEQEQLGWHAYGKGFAMDAPPARAGTTSDLSAYMSNDADTEQSGAMQVRR